MTAMETKLTSWTPVCPVSQVPVDCGVAALLDGRQVALFRLHGDDGVYALDNIDPFSGIGCLSRGIVGDVAGEPMVVSPLHKQRFSLLTGICFDDESTAVACHETRVVEGMVEVRLT